MSRSCGFLSLFLKVGNDLEVSLGAYAQKVRVGPCARIPRLAARCRPKKKWILAAQADPTDCFDELFEFGHSVVPQTMEDFSEHNADCPVPLTTEDMARRIMDSPVPLTMEDLLEVIQLVPLGRMQNVRGSAVPHNRKEVMARHCGQNKEGLGIGLTPTVPSIGTWRADRESRSSALLRLVADLEAVLLSGRLRGSRRETTDMNQKDIVESTLPALQQCVAALAYEWLAKQSS